MKNTPCHQTDTNSKLLLAHDCECGRIVRIMQHPKNACSPSNQAYKVEAFISSLSTVGICRGADGQHVRMLCFAHLGVEIELIKTCDTPQNFALPTIFVREYAWDRSTQGPKQIRAANG